MTKAIPFSKRYYQYIEVALPEPFRRRVLYVIYDSFKDYSPRFDRMSSLRVAVAESMGQPKEMSHASAYLHDIVVRAEGFARSEMPIAWLEPYALRCSPPKFLDVLDYLFMGRLRSRREEGAKINALFKEYALPYTVRDGLVRVVESAGRTAGRMPAKLKPSTPFGNRVAMRNLLRSCSGRIWWLERHMPKLVLEVLQDGVNAQRVSEIRLLSGPAGITRGCKSDFQAFVTEWNPKGVNAEWRILDEETSRQLHDRYIVTDGEVYNVPPVNSVFQASQLADISSGSVKPPEFEALWNAATDIGLFQES